MRFGTDTQDRPTMLCRLAHTHPNRACPLSDRSFADRSFADRSFADRSFAIVIDVQPILFILFQQSHLFQQNHLSALI